MKRDLFRQVRREYANGNITIGVEKNHFNDPAFWDSVIQFVDYLKNNPELLAPLELKWAELTDTRDSDGLVSTNIIGVLGTDSQDSD